MIRVLLADDHVMFREAITAILEKSGDISVIATASDGREALKIAVDARPGIAILDVFMPSLNGMDATRQMSAIKSGPRVILISGHHEPRFIVEGLTAGARAYIRKENAAAELVRAVREVAKGGVYLSSDATAIVARAIRTPSPAHNRMLSNREREVLQLVAEGRSTKEIAFILGVSAKTAEHHRERLMKKLDLHHVAGLTRYAVREGLVLL